MSPTDRIDAAVLQAVLRTRHTGTVRLGSILGIDAAQIESALARLTAAGHLVLTETGLAPVPPQEVLLATAAARLAAQADTARELSAQLDLLPGMMRDWEWGEQRAEHPLVAEAVHGPLAIIDSWWRYADRTRPVSTVGVIPDARAFIQVPQGDMERLADYVGPEGGGIRIIVGSDSLEDAAARAAVEALVEFGFQIRSMQRPPSWFFADGNVIVGLPSRWGDPWPTTVVLIRNAVVAGSLTAYFEAIWPSASAIDTRTDGWEPILLLLARGLGDDEIASRLALSPRTVRRRITEAMDEYGASNRFTLGQAWGRLS